jgi:hypothetical protein
MRRKVQQVKSKWGIYGRWTEKMQPGEELRMWGCYYWLRDGVERTLLSDIDFPITTGSNINGDVVKT